MVRAALRRLEEDEARTAAFYAAVDAGDASPDVVDFDDERFVQELKDEWGTGNGFAQASVRWQGDTKSGDQSGHRFCCLLQAIYFLRALYL